MLAASQAPEFLDMFTHWHQPRTVSLVSVLCAIAYATCGTGAPSTLSVPDTLVIGYPQNNVSLGEQIDLGFDDPPLPANYFGFWHNISASLRFPNGTVQRYVSAFSLDCVGTASQNIINSTTPIESIVYTYPMTDTGVYVWVIILVLQFTHQKYTQIHCNLGCDVRHSEEFTQ